MTPRTAPPPPNALAAALAAHLREARSEIVGRWLERIAARVAIEPGRIFPSEELLNHVPVLLDGLAEHLESPGRDPGGSAGVLAKAMELGALRHEQGFDAYEILKEHEILAKIISANLAEFLERENPPGTRAEAVDCWQRLGDALETIRQAAVTNFLRLWSDRVNEREERLRRFNRMVSHELKNRVGAIRGAVSLLEEPWLAEAERERFQRMVRENAEGLQLVLENLITLSRLEEDARQQRNVLLPQAVAEVVRQLRAGAELHRVEIRVDAGLPNVEVDAAAVELCMANYLSNAIKYSDPRQPERWVEVSAELVFRDPDERGPELVVRVRDNGIGVPEAGRARLFDRFYRAHEGNASDVEGTGLGLNIVRETVQSFGGRAWAEFPPNQGTVFAFSLPSRRVEDAASAGTRRQDATA
ncbi:MAG TPA: sensor histidine kinase [Longimicrobium sp.]|nr:sensor histidine kinase [Longimicrobium sp.]